MRVIRGRGDSVEADRAVTRRMLDWVAESETPAVRVWTPHRQVAFGRRDATAPGYEQARRAAETHGFPPIERSVGGRAVAYTGTTVAFARAVPVADTRTGLNDRYDALTADVQAGLSQLGVHATAGEPPDSFCPGAHSLQASGKLVGIAQRIQRGAALVAGICVVTDHEEIAAVLTEVYDALDVPFDPDSVGSVERAGGPADPQATIDALEAALAGSGDHDVVPVRDV
ncbi:MULTISPECIES: lipoate--protein ligase family protein [unclassified Haladaptatus]|uniref:lipoate--protein ligase family protein n=1 Tax=unclassified Haladaptatus TaxID=2622732 RepID=UPI0023E85E10|nr:MULTISPECIES: lipoate--protein ligase family protein [unclassified Haladaptatus]